MDDASKARVSSSLATGGAGTFFEQHVAASYLVMLLVSGPPPVFNDSVVTEISLQAEHLGWNTDDVVLTSTTNNGLARRLAIQIKRTFSINISNTDCQKVFTDFWLDFTSESSPFSDTSDALALCLQAGNSDSTVRNLRALGDIARASKDAADFSNRLESTGFTNVEVKKVRTVLKQIVESIQHSNYSNERFFRFLRSVFVYSLDLNVSAGHTESTLLSLLSYSAIGPDKAAAARESWNELLALASRAIQHATTISRESLPATVLSRHSPLDQTNDPVLSKVAEHSATAMLAIKTVLDGDVSLARTSVMDDLLGTLSQSPVVLVTGPAGSGKSALVKSAIEKIREDSPVLAFRAEEFGVAHLDQALQSAQIPVNAMTLKAMLSGAARKILFVDSVERLLEASSREAFLQLLKLSGGDSSWSIILTCRDYSVDVVRSSFLDFLSLNTAIVRVPPLSDDELSQVQTLVPRLARPFTKPFLRDLLRAPYVLDKAMKMSWSEDAELPSDESAFRMKFWSEIVRDDSMPYELLPQRRERALMDLCLRRSKALEPFAPTEGLDEAAILSLRNDSLVQFSPLANSAAAPAHDVLEDWAVMEWIGRRYVSLQSNRTSLAAELGSYPAIRRGYRKWLGDHLLRFAEDGDRYVVEVIRDASLPTFFRDDTLVSVLQSGASKDFLARNRDLLKQNGFELFFKVIHLVRVACRTTPPWVLKELTPHWFVPSGRAWPAVLSLIRDSLSDLIPSKTGLISGFLTDWAVSIGWWMKPPEGTSDAAAIAYALLPHLSDYRTRDLEKDVLRVIAKIPTGDLDAFAKLSARSVERKEGFHDHTADDFADVLLSGLDSRIACRDAPDDVIRIAEAKIFLTPEDLRERRHSSVGVESTFGVIDHFRNNFFPASAAQGPFLSLLRHNPQKGLAFVLRILNRACDCYANPIVPNRLKLPTKISLVLPDGSSRTYWHEWRLWSSYRGFATSPLVMQCALMALEKYLFELCDLDHSFLEQWLIHILKEANNTALVAVVASVATAKPEFSGKAGLALLTSPDLIDVDRSRFVAESQPHFRNPLATAIQKIFEEERVVSNALPHRKEHLEMLAFRLQLTPHAKDVWALIDGYRQSLPATDSQSDGDRLWRLALHRMDVRGFRAEQKSKGTDGEASSTESGKTYIQLAPDTIEADIKAMLNRKETRFDPFSEAIVISNWARTILDGSAPVGNAWREQLANIQKLSADDRCLSDGWVVEAAIVTAAVCVRFCWNDLSKEDSAWCEKVLAEAVIRDAMLSENSRLLSGDSTSGAREAAAALPVILSYDIDDGSRAELEEVVAVALLHRDDEIAIKTAASVGRDLAKKQLPLVLGFARLLVLQGVRLSEFDAEERKKDFSNRRHYEELSAVVMQELLEGATWKRECAVEELGKVRLNRWPGKACYKALMPMCLSLPSHTFANTVYKIVARHLATAWRSDRRKRDVRDFHFESDCEAYLSAYTLKIPTPEALSILEPVIAALDDAPKEVGEFVKQLVYAADSADTPKRFWNLWKAFSTRCLTASWLERLDDRHPGDDGLLLAMFLDIQWKENVTHWRHAPGYSHLIDSLFEGLPAVAATFSAYMTYLFRIGGLSLPNAFILVDQRLRKGMPATILANSNVAFCLEEVLKRHVYSAPEILKRDSALRIAVLSLLDQLVDAGSSVAFRMRDDFVTPGH